MKLNSPILTDAIIKASSGQEINCKRRKFGEAADFRFIRKGETVQKAISRLMASLTRRANAKEKRCFPQTGDFKSTFEYFEYYAQINQQGYRSNYDESLCLPFNNLSKTNFARNVGEELIDETDYAGVL